MMTNFGAVVGPRRSDTETARSFIHRQHEEGDREIEGTTPCRYDSLSHACTESVDFGYFS